ncbi:hypothetical protein ACWGQ5_37330 [Streptomyces sp. NPDC055722]
MNGSDNTNPSGLKQYPKHIRAVIRSEAEVWRYGDVASALSSFESTVQWARGLNQEQRKYHAAGYWYTNQNMHRAAVGVVQKELGDAPDCDSHLCPTGANCHPKPTAPGTP